MASCAALSVPQPAPVTYPTFFDLVLAQPRHGDLADFYGSGLPWETVRTEQQQEESWATESR